MPATSPLRFVLCIYVRIFVLYIDMYKMCVCNL